MDIVLVWAVSLFIGALYNRPMIGGALGILAAYAWHRWTNVRGRGYALALLYWYFGSSPFVRLFPSAKRHFVG